MTALPVYKLKKIYIGNMINQYRMMIAGQNNRIDFLPLNRTISTWLNQKYKKNGFIKIGLKPNLVSLSHLLG